jgi:hypothetical protein
MIADYPRCAEPLTGISAPSRARRTLIANVSIFGLQSSILPTARPLDVLDSPD